MKCENKRPHQSPSSSTSAAKCVFLINEYIRNVPLQLTVQILQDMINRFTQRGEKQLTQKLILDSADEQTSDMNNEVNATFPCMYAVLAKIQRTSDTADKQISKQQKRE